MNQSTDSKIAPPTESPKFETWAILEIMGHVKLAGFVTEQTIAGSAFIRIDVPERGCVAGFTRFFDPAACTRSRPSPKRSHATSPRIWTCDRSVPYDLSTELKDKWRRALPTLPAPPSDAMPEEWDDDSNDW